MDAADRETPPTVVLPGEPVPNGVILYQCRHCSEDGDCDICDNAGWWPSGVEWGSKWARTERGEIYAVTED